MTTRMMSRAAPIGVVAVLWFLASPIIHAQVHVLTAGSATPIHGETVTISLVLDNDEPVRGFSAGVTHDGLVVTLDSIVEGAALLATNGGTGPAFFFQDIAPVGGPGGTCGGVISFSAPLDEIPVGPGSELAVYTYTALPAVEPGASSSLDFSDLLADPPLETIVSVAGVTRIPTQVSGNISVVTAPVTGLTCTLTDPCTCEFTLGWTNDGPYDAIDIVQDGLVVQTLLGTATTAIVNLIPTTIGGPATSTLEVIARRNLVDAAAASCLADCPDVPDPLPPTGLTCTVDPFTGVATLAWTNAQFYNGLTITVDGAPVTSLPGITTSTTTTLPTPGVYTICLAARDQCDVAAPLACCTAVYEQIYVRGDPNGDGSFNISDPVYGLEYLFNAGPLDCEKALDLNDSGDLNIADVIFALQAIFGQIGLPSAPFPACGVDPTPDGLTCNAFPACP